MAETTNFLNNGIIKTGVYTCSTEKDEANEVITVNHGYPGHTPKLVFAYIEYGGTALMGEVGNEIDPVSPVNLFLFTTIPLVDGVPSPKQISFLIPDIPTIASNPDQTPTKIRWTAYFND